MSLYPVRSAADRISAGWRKRAPRRSERNEPRTERAATGQVGILYVDDDDSLVFLATRLLRRSGFDVEASRAAEDALTQLRSDPTRFDLLVTDMNMPGLSGPGNGVKRRRSRPACRWCSFPAT